MSIKAGFASREASVQGITGIPNVEVGDDIAQHILANVEDFQDGDVLVVAQKSVEAEPRIPEVVSEES